jgi:hypothetical protein
MTGFGRGSVSRRELENAAYSSSGSSFDRRIDAAPDLRDCRKKPLFSCGHRGSIDDVK